MFFVGHFLMISCALGNTQTDPKGQFGAKVLHFLHLCKKITKKSYKKVHFLIFSCQNARLTTKMAGI